MVGVGRRAVGVVEAVGRSSPGAGRASVGGGVLSVGGRVAVVVGVGATVGGRRSVVAKIAAVGRVFGVGRSSVATVGGALVGGVNFEKSLITRSKFNKKKSSIAAKLRKLKRGEVTRNHKQILFRAGGLRSVERRPGRRSEVGRRIVWRRSDVLAAVVVGRRRRRSCGAAGGASSGRRRAVGGSRRGARPGAGRASSSVSWCGGGGVAAWRLAVRGALRIVAFGNFAEG